MSHTMFYDHTWQYLSFCMRINEQRLPSWPLVNPPFQLLRLQGMINEELGAYILQEKQRPKAMFDYHNKHPGFGYQIGQWISHTPLPTAMDGNIHAALMKRMKIGRVSCLRQHRDGWEGGVGYASWNDVLKKSSMHLWIPMNNNKWSMNIPTTYRHWMQVMSNIEILDRFTMLIINRYRAIITSAPAAAAVVVAAATAIMHQLHLEPWAWPWQKHNLCLSVAKHMFNPWNQSRRGTHHRFHHHVLLYRARDHLHFPGLPMYGNVMNKHPIADDVGDGLTF